MRGQEYVLWKKLGNQELRSKANVHLDLPINVAIILQGWPSNRLHMVSEHGGRGSRDQDLTTPPPPFPTPNQIKQ